MNKKPILIPEWKLVLRKAWSMKFVYATVLLTAAETYFTYHNTGQAPLTSVIATLFALAIGISRIVEQQGMKYGRSQETDPSEYD